MAEEGFGKTLIGLFDRYVDFQKGMDGGKMEKLSGTCGTCKWAFSPCSIDDPYTFNFYIFPIDPQRGGVLDEWKDVDETGTMIPPWYDSPALDCGDILRVSISPGVKATTCKSMFAGFCTVSEIDLSGLDTSDVTDMSHMFASCSRLTSLDVSMLDTSRVKYMDGMFFGCWSLTLLDLSSWDVSSVLNMRNMFDSCSALTSLDIGRWDASRVEDMCNMFYDCSSLTTLDVSSCGVSDMTDMIDMFSSGRASIWHASYVEDMEDDR